MENEDEKRVAIASAIASMRSIAEQYRMDETGLDKIKAYFI